MVSKVTPAGELSIVAGNGTYGSTIFGIPATDTPIGYAEGVAVNADGTFYIADSNNNTIDRVGPTTPGAPSQLVLVAGDGTAQLSFTAPIDPGTSPITGYQVSLDGGTTWQTITTAPGAGNTLTTTLSGLTDGTTYAVRVRAVNTSGAGAASPSGSVTPKAPSPAPSPAPTVTTVATPTPAAGTDLTTAPTKLKSQSAVLGGTVAAHTDTVSYRFQYGTHRRYGHLTTAHTLAVSPSPRAVNATIKHLVPGHVYHYRIAVTASSGAVSYGADTTLKTPRATPRRVRNHIYSYWDQHGPYQYRVQGRMVFAAGLSHQTACQTTGAVTVTVTRGSHVLARRTTTTSSTCTYSASLTLTTHRAPGSGRLSFHIHFAGNRQLHARQARTLNVLYGPNAKTQQQ